MSEPLSGTVSPYPEWAKYAPYDQYGRLLYPEAAPGYQPGVSLMEPIIEAHHHEPPVSVPSWSDHIPVPEWSTI